MAEFDLRCLNDAYWPYQYGFLYASDAGKKADELFEEAWSTGFHAEESAILAQVALAVTGALERF